MVKKTNLRDQVLILDTMAKCDLSRVAIADRTGLSYGQICKLVKGTVNMSTQTKKFLLTLLELQIYKDHTMKGGPDAIKELSKYRE